MWRRWRWFIAGGAVGVLALVLWTQRMGAGVTFADLVDRFPNATQRRPNPDVFVVGDVTIGGQSFKSISVTQTSRIIWTEKLPANAWLDVNLGLREEAWARPGDGVLFLVGVSHDGKYDELVNLLVNPFANPADRQWFPLVLDLSPYADKEVEIIFNTRAGVEGATADNDLAVWGAPAIVTR